MQFLGVIACLIFFKIGLICAQKNPHFVENRTAMVHLFEWKWTDIARECEQFLGPQGYGGVQISPPNEHRIIEPARPWWERYQPISYLLISRSGTESELRDMIARCHRVGVRIYVDAIINHMSAENVGNSLGSAGSMAQYEKQQFPAVPYGPADFNEPCNIRDYNNPTEVRNCRLNTLLDLNHSKPHVRQTIVNYMNKLLDMGVAGFRVDAAKHMWPNDLNAIYAELHDVSRDFGFPAGGRPYIYQEVIDLGGEAIKKTDYNQLGDVTEFKYSTEIGRMFRGRNELRWLHNWGPEWGFLPSNDAVVFVDNHDNQRGHGAGGSDIITFKEGERYKLAVIFMLAHPYGQVTRVMSSYSFSNTDQGPPITKTGETKSPSILPNGLCDVANSGWICEHRWPAIAHMVKFRNIASSGNGDVAKLQYWWDNGRNQLAFARGNLGFVALNMEEDQEMRIQLQTGLPAGKYCDVISGDRSDAACTARQFVVQSDGQLLIELPKGPSAMAIHVASKLSDDVAKESGQYHGNYVAKT